MPAPLSRPALVDPSTAPAPAHLGAAPRPQRQLNLKPYNTFGIAATAQTVYTLDELAQVDEVLGAIRDTSSPLILSGGSNLLLARDLSEPVLFVRTQGRQLVDQQGDTVLLDIAAGEIWHDIVRWTIAQGYGGLENLALIPGRVGAAPWQNIGAYGVEVGDCIESVAAIHLLTGERRCFPAAECAFGYRQSFFKTPEGRQWLIVSVRLRLSTRFEPRLGYAELASALPSDGLTAAQVADTVETIRRRKLPDPAVLGNAGSFFHNPVVSAEVVERLRHQYPGMPAHPTTPDSKRAVPHNTAPAIAPAAPDAGASTSRGGSNTTPTAPSNPVHTGDTAFKLSAGWLIDQCGWKGYREGDAGVSPNHALVLVNHGNATGQQMLALANRIQQSVFERFGVNLHPEPVIIR